MTFRSKTLKSLPSGKFGSLKKETAYKNCFKLIIKCIEEKYLHQLNNFLKRGMKNHNWAQDAQIS